MKTAISIPDQLFEEVEGFSKKHRHSRSEVFVKAVRELLEKEKSRELLEALNEAYSENELAEETTLREKSKRYYAKRVLKKNHGD
jgi:metal-responsive CopG/Arc/MetJ family transcriptional regulator